MTPRPAVLPHTQRGGPSSSAFVIPHSSFLPAMSSPVERLAKFAKLDDLSCAQVAEIIGVTKEVVYDLVHHGHLECLAVRGNGRRRSEHRLHFNTRHTYHITPRQCLAYLVKATRGNGRETLMAEIELLLPKMLPFAQLIAKKHDDAAAKADTPKLPLVFGEPRKANREPRTANSEPLNHPEMFDLTELQRPHEHHAAA